MNHGQNMDFFGAVVLDHLPGEASKNSLDDDPLAFFQRGANGYPDTRTDDSSNDIIWVCLKMGYTPNYSHLVGIMIINHWV